MFKSNYTKTLEKEIEYHNKKLKAKESYEMLLKKYRDKPDTFIKDFDNMIFNSLVAIIHNELTDDILREDIINNVIALIKIRPFIIDYYSNNGSC